MKVKYLVKTIGKVGIEENIEVRFNTLANDGMGKLTIYLTAEQKRIILEEIVKEM